MPQTAAGWRIEPPVSVPIASGAASAATAAAEPPDEPPGTLARSHGLWLGPNAEFSVEEPIANSSMLVLPMMIAPVCFGFLLRLRGGRVFRGGPPRQEARAAGRRHVLGREDVLDRHRYAGQRG